MSEAAQPVTTYVEVKDYLTDSSPLFGKERAALYRWRKQANKKYTTCQGCGCGAPLLSKWGTLRGTDDADKAICIECKDGRAARREECAKQCASLRLVQRNKELRRKLVSNGAGGLNHIQYPTLDPSQYVVVPLPVTKPVGYLTPRQIERDERDYHRLDCVYEFNLYTKPVHTQLSDEERIKQFYEECAAQTKTVNTPLGARKEEEHELQQ